MTALSPVRWIAPAVAMGLGVMNLSAQQTASTNPPVKSFTEWCEQGAELAPETAHTVKQLLAIAGTQDCA